MKYTAIILCIYNQKRNKNINLQSLRVHLRSTRKSDFRRKDVAQIPTVFRRLYVVAV